jgi:hypothetical protein
MTSIGEFNGIPRHVFRPRTNETLFIRQRGKARRNCRQRTGGFESPSGGVSSHTIREWKPAIREWTRKEFCSHPNKQKRSILSRPRTPRLAFLFASPKNRTIVEYALKESSKPIGVATYRIVSSVPDELRNDLPPPDQIAKLLND